MHRWLLIICISTSLFAKELVDKDWALLKVEDKVYFLKELSVWSKRLTIIKCSVPADNLFFSLMPQPVEKVFEKKDFKTAEFKSYRDLWLRFFKLYSYVKTQKFSLDKKMWDVWQDKLKTCGGQVEEESFYKDVGKIMQFLEARFGMASFSISETDIQELKRKNPNENEEKLIAQEKEYRRQESFQTFMQSLERQIPHEYFLSP